MSTPTLVLPAARANPRRGPVRLILHDMKFGLISASRTPFPLTIALLFPLFFNVLFNLLNSGETVNGIPAVQSTTASIIVFVITAAGYFNMATGVVIAREKSVLKRVRQTPMPKVLHLLSRIGVSVAITTFSVIIMVAVALLAFGLEIRPTAIPALLLALLLGSFTSCALGLAVTRLIPHVEAALMVATASLFPLLFLSGVFFPIQGLPRWLQQIIDVLPFAPMIDAVRAPMNPAATGLSLDLGALGIIAAWGVLGLTATIRFMHWEPQR